MPVAEYPALPEMPEVAGTVAGDVFAAAVTQAVTAAGRDDMLPVLTGVKLEIDGSRLSLLATDRFRLSLRELEWEPDQARPHDQRVGPGPGAVRHRPVAQSRVGASASRCRPAAPATV